MTAPPPHTAAPLAAHHHRIAPATALTTAFHPHHRLRIRLRLLAHPVDDIS